MREEPTAMGDDGRRRVMRKVSEFRRGRNFIRVGDVVRVKALPGKRNGFEAKVRGSPWTGRPGSQWRSRSSVEPGAAE